MSSVHEELVLLANLHCEEQLDELQFARLQILLRSDAKCRSLFIEFVQLHGQLTWSGGLTPGLHLNSLELNSLEDDGELQTIDEAHAAVKFRKSEVLSQPRSRSTRIRRMTTAVACLTAVFILGLAFRNLNGLAPVVDDGTSGQSLVDGSMAQTPGDLIPDSASPVDSLTPLRLDGIRNQNPVAINSEVLTPFPQDAKNPVGDSVLNDSEVVADIDRLLKVGWEENSVLPASRADDHEWVRRAYLTLTGRIPSIEQATSFVSLDSPRKRDQLIDQLLESPQVAENLAVSWTNLLVGRSNPRGVDQESLYSFLMEQFSENRPWMETVGQLVAAEGRSDENGATNFLLAHLNDQATPATAVTARLFLGQQVHCTQCHDHPFSKERQQQEFWSLNAFFKQAERKQISITGKDGKPRQIWTLADSGKPGMTFYDTLRGQKKFVLPEFAGESLASDSQQSRRKELVRLLAADNNHQVARAMINRMWAHFFGYGFTNPVDDIGPHNPVSHPELLDHLTTAFVKSDYDLRRLMRWLSMTQAYQLSSLQSAEAIAADDPQEGGTPLFSRAYLRPMGPEQVYDSIRIAIRSVSDQPIDSSVGTAHRRQWVDQFVSSYGTDENDEQLAFDGNIAQAMLMMNGKDLEDAIPRAANVVTKALREGTTGGAPLRLAMATLNREPTENEEKAFRNRYRALTRSLPPEEAMKTATEDLLWAYLNSSEFVSVH